VDNRIPTGPQFLPFRLGSRSNHPPRHSFQAPTRRYGPDQLGVSNSCSAMYLDMIFHCLFTSTDDLCNGGYVNGTDHLSNASEFITELSSRSPHIGTMEASQKSPLLGIVKYDVCSTAYYPLLTSRCKGAHYVWSSSLRLQARIRAA
jgi:hypothetical protein